MTISRIGATFVPSSVDTSLQDTQPTLSLPANHRHHGHERTNARKPTNRPRTKRRKGADSQDGVDESGASEELLMMLDEHLQRNAEMVMRAGKRRHGGDQSSADSDTQSDDHPQDNTDAAGRAGNTHRMRLSTSDEDTADVADTRQRAEQALLTTRRTQGTAKPARSSTYEVLAAMLNFLSHPAPTATDSTLAAVRARLIEAVRPPSAAAPAHQHSINLLLPLMFLNLERKRTDEERARAIATCKSLIGSRRVVA
ncbi:hypothetical protein [Burkholderia lata]|uniref:hypothetical protein n=1 Tax=Burkholderia lata (strain ATCC 17760 / DSM 23089 / LMG 22485 / NCIMB 9086 / R18194 / 383) TaxID=482957 RepID=UPI0014534ECB|nr:hypothetical protein [Burkholderia lata]VWB88502.1 hypothetical protein BLA15816_04254 [Burkholderia lata]